MLSEEDFAVIKVLQKRGVYLKDITAELGVHPKTVSRAIERGRAPERKRKMRGSKLDPHKATVDRLLKENVWNAMVILREIEAEGYEGGITILREYFAPKRELRPSRATVRFETEPGKQLQSDWGEIVTQIAGQPVKAHFIVNELGYSRRFHFWCTDCEDAEHTYEGLIRSLEYFGGVPEEVLVDNQKCAVLAYPSRGKPHFNERFLDLAELHGFTPRACKPRRARTKGKSLPRAKRRDERMVGYIVLPKSFVKVRYYGFFSSGSRPRLATICQQLGQNPVQVDEAQETAPASETVHLCPVCGNPMQTGGLILPASDILYSGLYCSGWGKRGEKPGEEGLFLGVSSHQFPNRP